MMDVAAARRLQLFNFYVFSFLCAKIGGAKPLFRLLMLGFCCQGAQMLMQCTSRGPSPAPCAAPLTPTALACASGLWRDLCLCASGAD